MPEVGVCCGEGPCNAMPGESIPYLTVVADICAVIEVDKPMILHPPKDRKDGYGEKQADQKDALSVKLFVHHGHIALKGFEVIFFDFRNLLSLG
jgi:hypothetical protein